MSQRDTPKPSEPERRREDRLAEALRANLKRRKAQARRRLAAAGEPKPIRKEPGVGQD